MLTGPPGNTSIDWSYWLHTLIYSLPLKSPSYNSESVKTHAVEASSTNQKERYSDIHKAEFKTSEYGSVKSVSDIYVILLSEMQ